MEQYGQIESMVERASMLKEVRRYVEAIGILNEVLIIDPDNLEAMRLLCICKIYKGDIFQARIIAERMLQVNAGSDAAYFIHAELNYQTGYLEEAVDMINKAIQLNPQSPQYFTGKSKYHTRAGDPETGLQLAREALQLNPEYSFAFEALAQAHIAWEILNRLSSRY